MRVKITNKTGMRLRYKDIKFEANESKILDLESIYEHMYFKVEKVVKKKSNKYSKKLNGEELEKPEKKLNDRRYINT